MGLCGNRAGEAYSHVKKGVPHHHGVVPRGDPSAVLLGNTLFDVAEPNHSLIRMELQGKRITVALVGRTMITIRYLA